MVDKFHATNTLKFCLIFNLKNFPIYNENFKDVEKILQVPGNILSLDVTTTTMTKDQHVIGHVTTNSVTIEHQFQLAVTPILTENAKNVSHFTYSPANDLK